MTPGTERGGKAWIGAELSKQERRSPGTCPQERPHLSCGLCPSDGVLRLLSGPLRDLGLMTSGALSFRFPLSQADSYETIATQDLL